MRIILFFTFSVFSSLTLWGQQLSRVVVTTAGDFSENNKGISIDWTMGEIFSQTIEEDHHLTEGFQQGAKQLIEKSSLREEENIESDLEETLKDNMQKVEISVYPNPATEYITLQFNGIETQSVTARIIDEKGMLVFAQNIELAFEKKHVIEYVNDLIPGNYFILIQNDTKIIHAQSIIKI